MIKYFFVLRRQPGMSSADFHKHWKNVHAPLVAKLPGLVRYFQHHVMSIPRPEYAQDDDPIDGIVETWWESEEALHKVQGSPELQAVLSDETRFMGHSTHYVHTLFVKETVEVLDGSRAPE